MVPNILYLFGLAIKFVSKIRTQRQQHMECNSVNCPHKIKTNQNTEDAVKQS